MEKRNGLDHKVGIKLMDDITLENVFPMFENLKNKIEECRKAAQKREEKDIGHYHAQYNLMYDNVFSILGTRGTGKTSVAFTLREKIKQNSRNTNDVVFPIIIPEVIPDNCSILGWILAVIKEEADLMEKYLSKRQKRENQNDWENRCYWSNCDYQEGTERERLTKRLGELRQYLFAGDYNPSNERSYYAAIDNMSAASENNYQFANEFAGLWDLWVKVLKAESKNSSPLFFFIFDDVDLAPERIGELLSVITKYLAHPNLVVIVTADENLLLDVTERRLDKSIGYLPKEWRTYLLEHSGMEGYSIWTEEGAGKKKKDLSRDMAQMYLGKILPPSTRYYLQLFNKASQKANFWLKNDENLGSGICCQIEKLLKYTKEEKNSCFIKADGRVIDFYLNFFGNTCRQISNVYIGVQELVRNLNTYIEYRRKDDSTKNDEKYLYKVYKSLRYFLEIVVHCNQTLSDIIDANDENLDISVFIDTVFLTEYRKWKLYINYDYLNDFLIQRWQNGRKEAVEAGLQYYSLFAFVENILLILERCTENGITGRIRVNVVHPLVEFLGQTAFTYCYIFRDDLTADEFFLQYSSLLERLPEIIENSSTDKISDVEFFYSAGHYFHAEEELAELYQKNRRWFLEMTKMLARMYGNTYLISKDILEECIPFCEKLNRWGYQTYIFNFLKEEIVSCISALDLYEYARNIVDEAMKMHYENTDAKYNSYIFDLREELLKDPQENTNQVSDEAEYFVEGKNFLDYMQEKISAENAIFEKCPAEISNDLRNICKGEIHIKEIQRVIRKYVSYIEEIQYSIKYMCISDLSAWFQKFQDVQRSGIFSIREELTQIKNILTPILREINLSDEDILLLTFGIDNNYYILLGNLFGRILEKLGTRTDDPETVLVQEKVRVLVEDMDIVLDLYDPDMYRLASNLAIHMVFLAYLAKLYICLCIKEEYEAGRYLSSKKLENTYYSALFQKMKEFLALETEDAELNRLKHMIEETTRQQRRMYIEGLLEED